MSTPGDKLLITAIETGILTRDLFKTKSIPRVFMEKAIQANPQEFKTLYQKYGTDTVSVLGNICEESKIKTLRALASSKYLEEQPGFWGIVPHVFRPSTTPVEGIKFLEQNKNFPFKVDIPVDTLSTFMGAQYLEIETFPPELDPDQDPDNVQYMSDAKFTFTDKPGIRIIPELKFTSNGNTVQQYDYLDILRIDKENIRDSAYEKWNELICHDLFEIASVYNQATEVTYGVPTKTGFQTPKKNQDGLHIRLPLFFNHNTCFNEKFNLNSFLEGTLTIEGLLVASEKMVKAEYYPEDVTLPTVQLKCKPLRIKKIQLLSDKFFVNDFYHSLMSNKSISKFVRYFGNKTGYIKNNDPEEMIPINGKGYVEAFTFCLRPASYENDFSKWQQLSEVSHQCSPTAIVVKDNLGDFKKLVVKPASIEKPLSPLESLGMSSNGEVMKPMMDPKYYSSMESHRVANSSPDFRPRDNVLYKFFFNYHYKQKVLSGMFPQTKLVDTFIDYKFKDEYISKGLLKDKWQYIIYRDLVNQQFGIDSSVTTLYQL